MEASFLPKVERQGCKRKEHGHSLLFDSAMTDKVMRQNAYEERLLVKRTEHIEKEKQQTLEEYNYSKSQFLLRFLPVLQRQNELRKELLAKVLDLEHPSRVKTALLQKRPPSSFPNARNRICTANEKGRTNVRRTVSAELTFPALHESMDDILNGYRTSNRQPKSVSPTKLRLRGNWDLQLRTIDTRVQKETSTLQNSPKRKTTTKGVGFRILQDENDQITENMSDNVTLENPKIPKGKSVENFADVSAEDSKDCNDINAGHESRTVQQERINSKTSEETFSHKNLSNDLTKPKESLNGDRDDADKRISQDNFSKQVKFFQNKSTFPKNLLKDLIHTFKNDTTASNTARFLAKMLNDDEQTNFPCDVKENPGTLVSLGNSNGVHLLSDVKKRQMHDTQRLRIMRTIALAYDTVWNERFKKISSVA